METCMWYVEYKIPAYTEDKVHRSGPYSDDDIDYQLSDIRTYSGVVEAKKVSV